MLYKGSKPGSFMNSKFGNSFLRNAKGALSAAMITLSPDSSNPLIIGTHRVAWPNPQFNGHINTFFFNSLIFCKDNKSQQTRVILICVDNLIHLVYICGKLFAMIIGIITFLFVLLFLFTLLSMIIEEIKQWFKN